MKSMVHVLGAFLFLTQVQANVSELSTVKVFDGSTAHCRNLADQIRHNSGAYRYKAINAELNGDQLTLTSNIDFLKCDNSSGKFSFTKVPMNSDIQYSVSGRNIRVETTQSKVRMMRDGIYKIASENTLNNESSLVQNVDLSKVLTDKEKESIANGDSVKVSVDLFLLKNQTYHADGLESFKQQTSFGSFRVHLLISQDKVKILK